ncbi:hypothetical protein [Luteolibacter sp. LG18]|uniref:hypothetical protein n=1 Tax=Luteolibacter sp. LG18 TaxID=2819286 RepID=UPI002B2E90B5|nr:hypothetical protein llg_25930 [Luteolibacter sp. LG18]
MNALIKTSIAILAMAAPPAMGVRKPATSGTLNERRWQEATVRPEWIIPLDKAVARYRRDRVRYSAIERQRKNGVPAPVVFALHGRESGWDFTCHLHEGSPLTHRTRFIPKGRPVTGEPPFTFEQSAEDALYVLKHENRVDWRSTDSALTAIEAYNGTGYLRFHPEVPSPYLWSGTTLYQRGKYVADGRFSATAVDRQPGCAAILMRMRDRGLPLPFQP